MIAYFMPLLFVVASSRNSGNQIDYYWREYHGTIPSDAIVGGRNVNGEKVYIGQVYVQSEGLIVAQINLGEEEVHAPIQGVKSVNQFIKILCGPQEKFSWLSTNSTHIHLDLLNKHAVIGGHEKSLGTMNIGRISYEGSAQIGKINTFLVGNAEFRWVDINKKEPTTYIYEVLVYDQQKKIQCVY